MGKYDYSRNISFTKFYGNYDYYCHKQLTIKPMSITHGKATHLVDLNQAQASLSTKPNWVWPTHTHKSSRLENTWTTQLNFSKRGIAGSPSHQATTCLIWSEHGHVSNKGRIISLQAEVPSILKWHKAKDDVIESWESWKGFCQLLFLSSSAHTAKKLKLPLPDQ